MTELSFGNRRIENQSLTDPQEIENAIKLGEYIKNGAHFWGKDKYNSPVDRSIPLTETVALYSLRKYRYLKRTYDDDPT